MERTVEFPGLGLSFTFNNQVQIGSLTIAWYGIIIACGLALAVIYAYKRFKQFGVDEDKVFYPILAGIFGGIIGARIYYVAFSWSDYGIDFSSGKAFWQSIYKLIATWQGGMAIYGGIIGAMLVGLLVAKRCKVKLLPLLDVVGLGFLIGQGIGRWGNFVNVEAFGSNTTLPWGMTGDIVVNYLTAHQAQFAAAGITVDPSVPVHPCFLYESIWCLVGFVALHFYSKHRKFDGEVFLLYLAWYGLGRSWLEGLRTDSLMIGAFRVSQLLSILLVLVSLTILIMTRIKIHEQHDENYLKPYGMTDEWKTILAERAQKTKEEQSEKEKKLAKQRAILAKNAKSGAEASGPEQIGGTEDDSGEEQDEN
jgi:phosphatidylglycerol:prolipoprotein diacylglycerol transferase